MRDDRDNDGGIQYWQTVGQFQEKVNHQMKFLQNSATGSGGDFPVLSAAPHAARCYAVVDCGTHQKSFQGETKYERQIRLIFEVPSERMTDGRPMAISKTYKASMHEKARLRLDIEGWRAKKFSESEVKTFDIRTLLGRVATVGVSHSERDGKVYANISSILPPLKGVTLPEQENPSIYFDLDNFDPEVYEKLPKGLRERIAKSPEFIEATGRAAATVEDDDIPY